VILLSDYAASRIRGSREQWIPTVLFSVSSSRVPLSNLSGTISKIVSTTQADFATFGSTSAAVIAGVAGGLFVLLLIAVLVFVLMRHTEDEKSTDDAIETSVMMLHDAGAGEWDRMTYNNAMDDPYFGDDIAEAE
jgi:hypothetical protein